MARKHVCDTHTNARLMWQLRSTETLAPLSRQLAMQKSHSETLFSALRDRISDAEEDAGPHTPSALPHTVHPHSVHC